MGVGSHVAVLGGGVCGLYAARVLSRAQRPVTVLERDERPGGLSGGRIRGANSYDLGVHMFHQFDRELTADLSALMGAESIPVRLDARIRWAGAVYRYPLQFLDMLKGMPTWPLAHCVAGLLLAHLVEFGRRAAPQNAEEALVRLYGRPLYEFFFREFTQRYWGIPPRDLSATFVSTKMPRLTAVDAVKRILARLGVAERPGRGVESALMDETLLYSRTGAEALPRCLARAVAQAGGQIILAAEVRQIVIRQGRVVAIRYGRNGEEREIACGACLSTIPLPRLVACAEPAAPAAVVSAAARLRFKPIAIYGLLVRRARCLDALYIYYRDRWFHRIGEPKNAGMRVVPSEQTILLVETTCEQGDDKWRGSAAAREKLLADLEAEGICRREDILETHVFPEEFGYPVFARGFEPQLDRVRDWVRSIPNLQSTGRQGGFQYPNMHTAMRMGAVAAQAILDNKSGLSA